MTLASLRAELARMRKQAPFGRESAAFIEGKMQAFEEVIALIDASQGEDKPVRIYEDKAPA